MSSSTQETHEHAAQSKNQILQKYCPTRETETNGPQQELLPLTQIELRMEYLTRPINPVQVERIVKNLNQTREFDFTKPLVVVAKENEDGEIADEAAK
ncbi:hypothetical protein HDU89_000076 [Geranomyces variabilis]|nr:hypothetical protein HDU89_000076 [Geranomyces variabilis]